MTAKTRSDLTTYVNTFIQDNDTNDITPAEVRTALKDVIDSAFITLSDEIEDLQSDSIIFRTWAVNSSAPTQNMCELETGYSVGALVRTTLWFIGHSSASGGLYQIAEVRGVPYTGTLGTFSSDGYVEGLNYRFSPVINAGGIVDIRTLGVQCAEGVTGWHSRFQNIVTWAAGLYNITLTGAGILSCTETVDITQTHFEGENLLFQLGTARTTTGSFPQTFYTTTQTNREVTFTTGTPGVVNLTAHGLIAGDSFMFGVSHGGRLPGSLAFLTTYYVKDVLDADTFTISSTNGGAALAFTTAYSGTYYLWQGGTQNNITTVDFVEWSGKIKRLGVGVIGGALNGAIRSSYRQRVVVRGDGNFDWTTNPSCIGVLHSGDRGPHSVYDYSSTYCYVGTGTNTENEKHSVYVRGTYNKYLFAAFKPSSGTPDSMQWFISGANYQFAVYEAEGLDSWMEYIMRLEPRTDPASDANNSAGDDAPCYLFRNGKASKLSGLMRGHNGRRCIVIGAGTNSGGTSSRAWADTVFFDNFTVIHGYGTFLDIQGCRYVSGQIHVSQWDNANGVGQPAEAAFKIGRVVNASGLYVYGGKIRNDLGLEIGADGYYSRDAHLGNWSIDMGDLVQFNTGGNELTGASGNPTTLDAWSFVKGKNCTINLSGTRGKGTIGADVTENCKIILDSNARDYTLTTTAGCVATVDTGSSAKPRVVTAAGAVTVSNLDDIILVNKTVGAATTANLPEIALKGRVYTIKDAKGDANSNNITLTQAVTVTNSTFASDTAWTKGTGWTIAAGVASSDGSQSANSDLSQTLTGLIPGASYSVAFTVTAYTAGNIRPVLGGTAGTNRSSAATFTETLVAGSDGTIVFRADLDFIGSIDTVTITGLIDGSTTYVMNVNYQSASLIHNGTQWSVL